MQDIIVFMLINVCVSFTCKKMEHSHTEGRGKAAAQAGTDPNKDTEEHQRQRHQGQQKLAPPQVCTTIIAG